jgi:hypothetical protein
MQGTEIDGDEQIQQLAYKIWQEAGCPSGSDLQHWLKAEEVWLANNRPEKRAKPAKARKPRPTRTLKREL